MSDIAPPRNLTPGLYKAINYPRHQYQAVTSA